eukprot:2704-Prymnesium_polylepis.1
MQKAVSIGFSSPLPPSPASSAGPEAASSPKHTESGSTRAQASYAGCSTGMKPTFDRADDIKNDSIGAESAWPTAVCRSEKAAYEDASTGQRGLVGAIAAARASGLSTIFRK